RANCSSLNMAKIEGIKRKLKPVVKKKRRDRIDHNLEALRDLLFKNTADTCLQNPKMEKAEILDLAVQYIKKTTRKTEAAPNQSVVSASVGPTSDLYVSDFYWRFKSFEQKEVLLKLRVNLTSASKAVNEPVFPAIISHFYKLILLSQKLATISFRFCPLLAPPDSVSPLITPFSLQRPAIVHQPILHNKARDFTPPQSPVLALRPEPFFLRTQSKWRPWS
uniref:Hairy-related 11 n=1 Tax=Cyprinus carpio TaxID=7962 RepID=A0A8C1JVS3_CYPCA